MTNFGIWRRRGFDPAALFSVTYLDIGSSRTLERKKYGNASIQLHQRPRIVTVFLNPAVSRGKGVKMFEKNAAPLLHLAGIVVNVVKVSSISHVVVLKTIPI
ncbi:acylglycerol kinase, mitochondrial-like [Octopus bimaculoides]|uniref:acylglycerol kinase, mitochondrial-like n=1 Tax=Octopus bimaculoides TaxID=37653 RepID=UPI0022E0759A|nr:acylglycerol kinase, mitochondrial-like [Octopus bimaculoides]